ncbi:GATA zinc finger [Fusarium tjaetaba]|uniref:GATA zinc finger n=1 Tax=Fusarium tjaetaba TaxID=1567544 RepID=A0A8H5SAU3_9HYPO|nr:GATA zinc finger [Fusarium tjaetaba]KAF5649539.1 GATA zinc finger [Fusarium tjaetaba]
MKSSRSSDDSGPSNHRKPPSLSEILPPHLLLSHRESRSPSASTSHGPTPTKQERASLPQPIHPDFNLPRRLHHSSTGLSDLHARALILNPAAQARHKDVLERYPGNKTYREMLAQIMSRSHAISNFAEANRRIALKQYLTQVNLARLPKEEDINEMLRNQEIVKQLLQQVNSLQSSLRTQSGPGPSQQHMIGLSATRPMIASTEVPKLELRDVAIALDLLLAYHNSSRLYVEIAILFKQDRGLNKAPGMTGLSEA